MKKHLLALAAGTATLALTTGAFAQSTGDNKIFTDQNGTTGVTQNLTVNQSGSNGNVGFDGSRIGQYGGGNDLVVNQGGDRNSVGGFNGQAVGQSFQNGNNNSLNIEQAGGVNNGVIFKQEGSNNGRRAASAPPVDRSPKLYGSPVDYGVYPGKTWNYIGQRNGEQNTISATQNGDRNGLILLQTDGVRNSAELNQRSASGISDEGGVNLAYFSQSGGRENSIKLDQYNPAGNTPNSFNSADIRQSGGNGNVVARYDSRDNTAPQGAALQYGYGLDLFSSQTGSYNQLSVDQQASNSVIESVQNGTGGYDGERNRVQVIQRGEQQKATFQQNGRGNLADVQQYASYNVSDVYQLGNDNKLISYQGDGGNQFLLATQNGDNNQINNIQVGNHQTAYIDQNGNRNTAVNYQSGSYNASYISQGSNGNLANVQQNGTANIATITQNASAMAMSRPAVR